VRGEKRRRRILGGLTLLAQCLRGSSPGGAVVEPRTAASAALGVAIRSEWRERERSATEQMQGMKPWGHACGRGEIRWAPRGCDFFLPTA
jgi:hypothetical protein